jgi:uncharacterized membrane protein YgcG
MLNLSAVSTKETHITFASIVLMASLFLCTSAYAQTKPNANTDSQIITSTPITTKNYPPIAPTPLSSSLMSKTHELQQQALLMPRTMTKSPIRPASQASSELIVSVNVTKNPITRGEPEVFRIAIHDPNSNNNVGNARISGIVLDPTRNSIQNKFNGTSNSNGTYSYSWTIPRTVKSQTYQVKVNASTVDPVLYSLKPGVAVFSVNSISSGSTTSHHHVVSSHSSSNHHGQGSTDHSSSNHHGQGSTDHSSSNHHGQGSTDHSSSNHSSNNHSTSHHHGPSASAGGGGASASAD